MIDGLKTFKPITPGLRQLVIVDRSELYKGKPVKALTEGKSSSGGRNNTGRVTVRFVAAATSAPCATSTSSVARVWATRRPWAGSSTIRTAPPSSR